LSVSPPSASCWLMRVRSPTSSPASTSLHEVKWAALCVLRTIFSAILLAARPLSGSRWSPAAAHAAAAGPRDSPWATAIAPGGDRSRRPAVALHRRHHVGLGHPAWGRCGDAQQSMPCSARHPARVTGVASTFSAPPDGRAALRRPRRHRHRLGAATAAGCRPRRPSARGQKHAVHFGDLPSLPWVRKIPPPLGLGMVTRGLGRSSPRPALVLGHRSPSFTSHLTISPPPRPRRCPAAESVGAIAIGPLVRPRTAPCLRCPARIRPARGRVLVSRV